MKFTVSSSALSAHLQTISRVINPKSPLPILDKFLFTLEGKRLTLTAADMESMMQTYIDLEETEGSGSVALGSKQDKGHRQHSSEPQRSLWMCPLRSR